MRFVVAIVLAGGVAHADPAAFRAAATQYAAATGRILVSSGAAHLDDRARSSSIATLMPADPASDTRGAYVIEAVPHELWVISFPVDGRTSPFRGGSSADRAIIHQQTHHHGGETISFTWRGGVPVVIADDYIDDITDAQDRSHFACAHCPPLATFDQHETGLVVTGPIASIDQLVEGPILPLGIDWDAAVIASDADALALWQRLAITAAHVDKLEQIPDGPWTVALARALLHGGNFRCRGKPAPTAGFTDPCVRRRALPWALGQLATDPAAVNTELPALRALVASPGDELIDQLIEIAALTSVQTELAIAAWRAGHHRSAAIADLIASDPAALLPAFVGDRAARRAALASRDCNVAGAAALAVELVDGEAAPHAMSACVAAAYQRFGGR